MTKPPFIVKHGTYPYDLIVCVGNSDEEVHEFIEKGLGRKLSDEEKESLVMTGIGRTVMCPGNWTVLRVKDLKDRAHFHANLSHEVFHAVTFLFDTIGLPHSLEGDEAWAYQIAHVTQEIYKQLYART